MNRRFTALLSVILTFALLAGCGNGSYSGSEGSEPSESPGTALGSQPDEEKEELGERRETPEAELEGTRNMAIKRVQGFDGMPEDSLVGIKNYHYDMGWLEANQIINLERLAVENGSYLLIVPHYAHSRVLVERMDYEIADFDTTSPAYLLEDCPDDYALIVNTMMPEGMPDLRVTVSHGGRSATYTCSYDGRGDTAYPVIRDGYYLTETRVEQQDEQPPAFRASRGAFPADVDYGHAGRGYYVYYTANVPEMWIDDGIGEYNEYYAYQGAGARIQIWGFLDLPSNYHNVTHFLDYQGETAALDTPDGNTIYRIALESGNLVYAFELPEAYKRDSEGTLCAMVEVYGEETTPSSQLKYFDETIGALRDSMQTELVQSDFKEPPSL